MKVVWTIPAKVDLDQAVDFAVVRDELLAATLLDEAAKATDFLADFPHAGAPLDEAGLRKLRLGKLPNILIYRLLDDRLEILRVQHSSMDWRS